MDAGLTKAQERGGSKWCWRPTRLRVYLRDRWRCVWCGERVRTPVEADVDRFGLHDAQRTATLDHFLPRALGGSNAPDNLVTACLDCNTARANVPAVWFPADVVSRAVEALLTPLPVLPNHSMV